MWAAVLEQNLREPGTQSLHNFTEALPGMLSSVKADGPRLKVRGGKDLGEPTVQGYYWEQE